MDKILSNQLRTVQSMAEKAALVAEYLIQELPEVLATVTRRCVLLHWFDSALIEAFLQDIPHANENASSLYAQVAKLSFIETSPMGLAVQAVTRAGLLRLYEQTQPELLRTAARLAAPVFAAQPFNSRLSTEAYFCYQVAGNQWESREQFINLLTHGIQYEDWSFVESLFALRNEAEQFSFVVPLALSSAQVFLCNLALGIPLMQKVDLAYQQHTSRWRQATKQASQGTRWAIQNQLAEAVKHYDKALQYVPTLLQAHIAYALTLTALHKYDQAIEHYTPVLQALPDDPFLLQLQGSALLEDMYYEEALSVYDHVLELEKDDAVAYLGKGKALFQLKHYEKALTAIEYSIFLESRRPEAFYAKGECLYELKQYGEAQTNFDKAKSLTLPQPTTNVQAIGEAAPQTGRARAKVVVTRRRRDRKVKSAARTSVSSLIESSIAFIAVPILIAIFAVPFLFFHRSPHPNHTSSTPTITARTPSPNKISKISAVPYSLGLTFNQVQLLQDDRQEINKIKQQILTGPLGNQKVALVIAYGSAPTDNDIPEALQVSNKIYQICQELESTSEMFRKATTYNKSLFTLGVDVNSASLDLYLYTDDTTTIDPHIYSFFITSSDVPGILKNSATALDEIKKQILAQPILRQSNVALAIVAAGAPADNDHDITQAVNIKDKIDQILAQLIKSNPAFSRAIYEDKIEYNLGYPANQIEIDFLLFK